MRMHSLLLAGLLAATGCVGGISSNDDTGGDDGGDDGTTTPGLAKEMYERDVYPIMKANCTGGCHGVEAFTSTPFVTADAAGSWETVTGYNTVVGNFTEAGAPIWFKIVPGPHNARTYDAAQQATISAWLAQEVVDRAAGPVDDDPLTENPGQATARLISEWSGCLNLNDFIELRFGEVWANKGSTGGNCEQCHQDGGYGMIATDDNAYMYQVLSSNKYYMLMFFKPNVIDLANAQMQTNEQQFINVGLRIPPHTEHPAFDPRQITGVTGTAPIDALVELYNRTMGYKAAGTCGTPIIPQ